MGEIKLFWESITLTGCIQLIYSQENKIYLLNTTYSKINLIIKEVIKMKLMPPDT